MKSPNQIIATMNAVLRDHMEYIAERGRVHPTSCGSVPTEPLEAVIMGYSR